jgi:hypothetical protein
MEPMVPSASPAGRRGGLTVQAVEVMASLAASHLAGVATISWSGQLHLTPTGYRYDGKVFIVITCNDRLQDRHRQ